MDTALAEVWMTEFKIADKLNSIMEEAFTSTPEGQIIPDFKTMLEAIKVWHKLKKKWPDTVIAIPMIFWQWNGSL